MNITRLVFGLGITILGLIGNPPPLDQPPTTATIVFLLGLTIFMFSIS